jgi:hypothetical protein
MLMSLNYFVTYHQKNQRSLIVFLSYTFDSNRDFHSPCCRLVPSLHLCSEKEKDSHGLDDYSFNYLNLLILLLHTNVRFFDLDVLSLYHWGKLKNFLSENDGGIGEWAK